MSVSCQSAYFAHANVFHHDGKPVHIELSIATIPRDGSDPKFKVGKYQPILESIHVTQQSIKFKRSATRDILTQQHVSFKFFAHANVFHHGGQPVPIELSIAIIPEDGKDPEVICHTVDHSNLITTSRQPSQQVHQ
ncbi:UNVERIFIED_CONTAM: hypothetical protein NCL1_39098 [Trichonephila clavipes]